MQIRYNVCMWSSIGTAIVAFILFLIFMPLWGMYMAVRPPHKLIPYFTPTDQGIVYEEVKLETDDGLTLSAWFIPNENPDAKAIILMHGYPAEKGDILHATTFLAEDYHLLYFDFRALGESEGTYTTIGATEGEDLTAAVRFLGSRGIEEIGLWGFSMGGAVALMATPELPQVRAVVADSSYSSLAALAVELYRLPLLRHVMGEITNLWGWAFFGIHPQDVSPAEAARGIEVPVFIIHSKQDEVISFEHALRIQESLSGNASAQFWFREQTLHGEIDTEYQEKVSQFFYEHL